MDQTHASDRTLVHRTCTICEATCGITVEVEGGRALRVRGDVDDPFSRGHVCPKAKAMLDLETDPDRLRVPHLRTDDGFVPIGWDEALERAAAGLASVRDAHGPNSIGLYRGNPTVHDFESILYWNVLERALPTRNRFSAGSVDTWPRWVQAGTMFGGFLFAPVPDIDRTDYFLMFGANPLASHGSLMTAPGMKKRIDSLRARGGKLIVVDPRRSETADRADEHHFVRPGSDAVLALAMIHVLFDEGLVDLGRCAAFTNGVEEVRRLSSEWTPERAAPVCGIEAETLRRLARDFAGAERAVAYGRMGTCVQRFGTLASWAVELLNVLTGNLDREGGAMFATPAVSLQFAAGDPQAPRFGRWQSPGGWDEIDGEYPMAAFAEQIETPGDEQIRALAIIAGNPVSSAPNSDRVDRALGSLEFMVAFDYYVNETTRHADLILPPTPPLEHATYDAALMHFAVRNVAKWSPAAVPAPEGALSVWEALLGLAKRLMGLGAMSDAEVDAIVVQQLAAQALPHSEFAETLEPEQIVAKLGDEPGPARILDLLLRLGPYGDGFGEREGGLALSPLRESEHGIDLGALEPVLPGRLRTPSGRIELAPERVVADLPRLAAWADAPVREGHRSLIGRRDVRSMNSWLHNLESLAGGKERCTLQVNPEDAFELGLRDAGEAEIKGRVGSLVARVEVTDRMAPGTVSLPHGWGHDLDGVRLRVATARPGVNANRVVDDAAVDVPSGTSALNGIEVEIAPVA